MILRAHVGGLKGIGAACFREVKRMLLPSVSPSAVSGASDSPNSLRASRPVRISAPASSPSRLSPGAST